MHVEVIREAVRNQPFRPFAVHLADGRELVIPHPDFIAIVGSRQVIVSTPGSEQSYLIIEPLMIVSLDYTSNGTPESTDSEPDGS